VSGGEVLRFARHVVVADGQDGIVVVAAGEFPPRVKILGDREAVRSVIARVRRGSGSDLPELPDRERAVVEALVALGALRVGESRRPEAIPAPQTTEELTGSCTGEGTDQGGTPHSGFVPFLGAVRLTVVVGDEQGGDGGPEQLELGVRQVLAAARELRRLTVSIVGREPLAHLDAVTARLDALVRVAGDSPDRLRFELETPLEGSWSSLPPLLDRFGLTCVVEDRRECGDVACEAELHPRRVEAVQQLSREGFDCPVSIPTAFGPDLPDRATQWLEANEGAGIRFQPLLGDRYRGYRVPRPLRPDDASRAAAVLDELAVRCGDVAHRCEPWATILTAALVPSRARAESKPISTFHLEAGRWYRSARHAELGLDSSLDELLAEPGWSPPTVAGPDDADWPRCSSCGLYGICDGFGDSEVAVSRVLGDQESARAAAAVACATRTTVLGALVETLERHAGSTADQSAVHLRFGPEGLEFESV